MMKARLILSFIVVAFAIACHNGNDSTAKQDSGNKLTDTLPANGPGDRMPADSNPPDATKIDSGNRSPN